MGKDLFIYFSFVVDN